MSRLPNSERSLVQSGQGEVADGPGEANSDSGDSLFITQKDVPEAVRSWRRHHNLGPDSKIQHQLDLAELGPDPPPSSSSSSDEEPKTARKRKNGCYKVPKFKFSFLNENNKSKPIINNVKNAKFQSYAMASFITSVRELWRSFELGGDLAASLPTIDKNGEILSSMSEGGEETSEDEDIKVVERKCFVTPLRETRSQSWNSSDKRSNEKKRQIKAFNKSQKEQEWTDRGSKKLTKEFLSSASESSDDGAVVLKVEEASKADILTQTERLTAKRLISNVSFATACQPSPEKHTQRDQEVRVAPAEINSEEFHMDEQSKSERAECELENQNTSSVGIYDDSLCRKSRVKKRKKIKDREDGKELNQKEIDDQHDLVDIAEEEQHLSQQSDAPVLKLTEKRRKKKKEKSAEDVVRQGQSEEQVEDDSVEKWTISKKRKKKKEKSAEEVGQGQPEEQVDDDFVENNKGTVSKKTKRRNEVEVNTAAETTGDGSTQKQKKKKKKKHLDLNVSQTSPGHQEETGKHLENTKESQEITESRSTKRKKKKESTSTDDPPIAEHNDAVTMETDVSLMVKKKKKKRRSISVTDDIWHTAEEDENTQKEKERAELKTKKKKMRESSSAVICEETVASGDDSVSTQKKKKKSSFLAADEVEKSRKKHKQQHSSAPSAAPPDSGAEALTAASADATEVYSKSKDGGKKRRSLLLQSVWKEKQILRNWRMHPKRKKKPKRNDSDVMSSTEKLESYAVVENSQTDEAVVKKKKKKR
uniref:Retinitis pigmentosa GTPase regulator a n=1 Tax=Iconisemion striatum TaxID=60296 RepID=A0A1A7YLQ2_9TELE